MAQVLDNKLMLHGFGQIGQTLVRQILRRNERSPHATLGFVSIADRSGALSKGEGFSQGDFEGFFAIKSRGAKLCAPGHIPPAKICAPGHIPPAKICAPERTRGGDFQSTASVFVDVTDDESFDTLIDALDRGMDLVLANKKPLAVPFEKYATLIEKSRSGKGRLRYEATVGAGLPVLDTIHKLESSGDEIHEIVGCLSGTLGYLMSEIEGGTAFSDAVRKASALGFTEPDPRDDLSGLDVARKALILARRLGQTLNLEDIALEALFPPSLKGGDKVFFLNNLDQLNDGFHALVGKAGAENCVLRYVARISRQGVRVGLENLPRGSPLGRLKGTENLVSIRTDRYSQYPLCISGPGAGAEVTAAGVLNDVLALTYGGRPLR